MELIQNKYFDEEFSPKYPEAARAGGNFGVKGKEG
jgi:hypothetical protein